MEKLLNLLKQYWRRTFNDETLLRIYYEEKTDCFCWMYQPRPGMKLEQGQMLEAPVVFSKRFGFIEWLVENDKIDFENQAMQYAKEDLSKFFTEWKDKDGMSDDYAMILMLLAIQDNPIEFLISILR